ncbi:winged helix-turn-helix domain-containing protein [Anaerosporobacter faecicola]|uniref:winged helix-turn-helix domain-containing protein n=1 Tax=Anaerosporobacter faecicola TaxID=2718714 RepID=UPI0014394C2F|nr:winged helix-turn-helix domain-containing protein [Anaerosporobacter faecicola]
MLTITEHVNLVNEIFNIFYFMVNQDDLEDTIKNLQLEYQDSLVQYQTKCNAIRKIYQHVQNNMVSEKEEITYFFKSRGKAWLTYGSLAMCWNPIHLDYGMEEYADLIKNQSERDKYKAFMDVMEPEEENCLEEDEVYNLESLVTYLENTSLDSEICFEILKIYKNRESYFERLRLLIDKGIQLMKDCQQEIFYLEKEFVSYWAEKEKEKSIIARLQDELNVQWIHSAKETILTMTIINLSRVTITLEDTHDMAKEVITMGAVLNTNLATTLPVVSKDKLLKIGKVLADKSKLEILELVSKKASFGKEIAADLKLSTPTISYHMNTLVEVGFVKVEVLSGRIYYSMDLNKIKDNLDKIKAYFEELANKA